MTDENQWWNSALRLLSRREHTSAELKMKLRMRGAATEEIDRIIEKCWEYKYIDDARAAEMHVRSMIAKGWGRMRIAYELKRLGIDRDLSDNTISRFRSGDQEEAAARKAAEKKLERMKPGLSRKELREKLIRHLAGKGFQAELIYEVTASLVEEIR